MSAHIELEVIGGVPDEAPAFDLAPLGRMVEAADARREELGLPAGTINLSFIDDAAIQAYNRDYSGNDYPTDVLSFSYIEDGEPIEGVIGEMVISFETAARQAEQAQVALSDEVAILAIHGLLHISGFDHQTDAEREAMQGLQRELAVAAGVPYREFAWLD